MSHPTIDKQKELFESDILEVAGFINDFARNETAIKLVIHSLSSEKLYDEEGLKYLIGLFYAGSVMCDDKDRTYIRTLEEMLKLEKRLRDEYDKASFESDDKILADDKLN